MIQIDAKKLSADVRAVILQHRQLREELAGEETMTAVAEQGVTIIQARTQRGVDADGAPFKAYSSPYAAKRAKSGRSTRPDLTYTGRMLGNIRTKFVAAGKALIIFGRSEDAQKAAGNSHRREFFDIRMPAEVEALRLELERRVNASMRRLGLA